MGVKFSAYNRGRKETNASISWDVGGRVFIYSSGAFLPVSLSVFSERAIARFTMHIRKPEPASSSAVRIVPSATHRCV